jgi:hypothetical protein
MSEQTETQIVHDWSTGELITYEIETVKIESSEPESQESTEEQIQARLEAKASAIAKLTALGLTEEEVNAIIGSSS